MQPVLLLIMNSVLLGLGLAMDAFSVSLVSGMNEPHMRKGRMTAIAGTFAGFQFAMITKGKWWKWLGIILLPLGYLASESGWLVAEFGRQPWTIQDMMPTWVGVSDLSSNAVIITFFLFLFLFTVLLAVEINILCKQIKKGPEYSK